ncbi:MAG: hypothetical protein ACTSQE_06745 [Candidatus Heimdallarchaeaceae archaeon]
MEINEDNYLSLAVENLGLLRVLFDNEAVPTMDYDGNREDKMEELELLMEYLQKTN